MPLFFTFRHNLRGHCPGPCPFLLAQHFANVLWQCSIKTDEDVKQRKKKARRQIPSAEEILAVFQKQNRPLRLAALLKIVDLPRHAGPELEILLRGLADEKRLLRLPGGIWVLPRLLKILRGRFRPLPSGGGIVAPEGKTGKENGIFIPRGHTLGAWPGDLVSLSLMPGGGEGIITGILERDIGNVCALVLKSEGGNLLCRPVGVEMPINFSVILPREFRDSVKAGILVELRPEKQLASDLCQATFVGILGKEDEWRAQEAIVKLKHNVPTVFPALALEQAASLPARPSDADMASREDARQVTFITIDGADARDFDDAVYVEKTSSGWILKVAIADVSHYVAVDSARGSLDDEALRRGNSWYFPASVEPMLPKELSNGLCSLRPGEDRLAMLAEIPFSSNGDPGEPRFAPAVIRSAARLTYDQANAFLDGLKSGNGAQMDAAGIASPAVEGMLRDAFGLYLALARRRKERGSLDFEIPEAAYSFGSDGRLRAIEIAVHQDANRLIEDFMIAANEAVARYLEKTGLPFLFRDHPAPESEKLATLYETLKRINIENLPPNLYAHGEPDPRKIKEILANAKGSPQEFAVNRMCLRSMQQARYMPENTGHFGLASMSYCHFTSPIRRYADLLTHRALKSALGLCEHLCDRKKLWEIGEHLNKTEREAMECEREMARRLGCLLLKDRVGEVFPGVISGITGFGLFVEFAAMPVEGLIRLADLGDDRFEFDEENMRLTGLYSGLSWKLGQPLLVRLEGVDWERMEIHLAPAVAMLPARKREHARRSHHRMHGGASGNPSGGKPLFRKMERSGTEKRSGKHGKKHFSGKRGR